MRWHERSSRGGWECTWMRGRHRIRFWRLLVRAQQWRRSECIRMLWDVHWSASAANRQRGGRCCAVVWNASPSKHQMHWRRQQVTSACRPNLCLHIWLLLC